MAMFNSKLLVYPTKVLRPYFFKRPCRWLSHHQPDMFFGESLSGTDHHDRKTGRLNAVRIGLKQLKHEIWGARLTYIFR